MSKEGWNTDYTLTSVLETTRRSFGSFQRRWQARKAWLSVNARLYYTCKVQCGSMDEETFECESAHELVHQLSFLAEQLGVCKD